MGNLKKKLQNSMTTPTLQQQNIAQSQSHFFPTVTVLEKKVGQLKIDTAKLPVNEIFLNCEIWKELDQTKRMQPTGIFSNHLFRGYSSLKMTCLKRYVKTEEFFVTCKFRF
jgi:hypothetical protein